MTDPSTTTRRCPPAAAAARVAGAAAPLSQCPGSGRSLFRAACCGPAGPAAPGLADLTWRAQSRVDACGPGRQASTPRRPASGSAASTPGNGEGAHEVTARDHPAPAPAGLPHRQGRAAVLPRRATRPRGLSPFPFPQAGRPARMPAAVSRAGAGLDAAGRAERPSSRPHGQAPRERQPLPAGPPPPRPTNPEPRATRC
jgi:hypothetical protein